MWEQRKKEKKKAEHVTVIKCVLLLPFDKPQNITEREKKTGGQMGLWQIFVPNQQNAALWITVGTDLLIRFDLLPKRDFPPSLCFFSFS